MKKFILLSLICVIILAITLKAAKPTQVLEIKVISTNEPLSEDDLKEMIKNNLPDGTLVGEPVDLPPNKNCYVLIKKTPVIKRGTAPGQKIEIPSAEGIKTALQKILLAVQGEESLFETRKK